MRRISHLIIAALLVHVGCSREYEPLQMQEPMEFEFTLEAELGGLDGGEIEDTDPVTKASATTVVRLKWAKGDEISVINLTTGKALGGSLVADKEGTTTTFSGTLSGTVRNGDKMIFLYPSQGYTQEQDYEPVTIDLSQQKGNSKENVPICVYAIANASGNTFSSASATFKFLMSYLQLSFANLEKSDLIKEVKVENIGNAMTLSLSSEDIVVTPSVGTITMTPPSYTTTSTGTKAFYISFAESSKVSGRKITAWSEKGLKAGNFSGSALAANTSYTSTVADFKDSPVPFADDAFKAYCVDNFDTDGDGEISLEEAKAVTSIDCSGMTATKAAGMSVSVLDGLQYFPYLESLTCRSDNLTTLDVSRNPALTYLDCSLNELTELDVTNNPALSHLAFEGNRIAEIDLSHNTALTYLDCVSNNMTELDVSINTSLVSLHCFVNNLSSIDISKNTALEYFNCSYNQLTSIDVSKNVALVELWCHANQLSILDVSKNTALTTLWCEYNQLSRLDVSKNTALIGLGCHNNNITELTTGDNPVLSWIDCNSNQLSSLDVSRNTGLQNLGCSENQLTNLNVTGCVALENLSCYSNLLTSLDLSRNTALTLLACGSNNLSVLDVSHNTVLSSLSCEQNQISDLSLGGNLMLKSITCHGNNLTSLDVSENTILEYLDCSPMSTLGKLIMKEGQIIDRINSRRSSDNIPDTTIIEYKGDTDMGDGGDLESIRNPKI